MDEIFYSKLQSGEEEIISKLIDVVFDEFVALGYSQEGIRVFKEFISPSAIRSHIDIGYLFLIARLNNCVVGTIAIREWNHISLLFVDKKYQGMGIAKKLFSLALENCLERNPKLSEFFVNSSPYAVPIYEKLGFKKTQEEQEKNGIRFIPMRLILKGGNQMDRLFADRTSITRKSFIREILKVTEDPSIISFAGGLPNPRLFPSEEIAEAASKVLKTDSGKVLQYSTTEGYYPLRKLISERYLKKSNLKISPEEILITNGSQQGIDLIGKVFLNKGDHVLIESPGYLGAIQALSTYEPEFHSVQLNEDGIDTELLERVLNENNIKIFYTVPNFQNPSGISYTLKKRLDTALLLQKYNTILVEDDPYGELRFLGKDLPYIGQSLSDNSILLGSFSKIVAPGLRLGWICAPKDIMEKIVIAKQASDLHSNFLSQRIIYQYLSDYDIESHIAKIKIAYKLQRDAMVSAIDRFFPEEVTCTKPEGGMFIWVTLPCNVSSLELFDLSIKENVAFVPGSAFYVDGSGLNTLRLNYSNSDEKIIEEGIQRLAKAIKKLMYGEI